MAQSRSSGSHYALTAIGLGMLALGIIMAIWNLVPSIGNSSKTHLSSWSINKTESGGGGPLKNKTFSVAYVLVGAGVLLLLFSICLSVRDRRRQRQNEGISRIRQQTSVERQQQEDSQEEDEESLSRYYVPSYEEVMNRDYPHLREVDRNARISMSLPSYESLTGIDESTPTRPPAAAAAAAATTTTAASERPNIERQPSRHSSRLGKKLKPLKVRRIKSEKLHLKNIRINIPDKNSSNRITIEPLTPPPLYDETPKKLPDSQEET